MADASALAALQRRVAQLELHLGVDAGQPALPSAVTQLEDAIAALPGSVGATALQRACAWRNFRAPCATPRALPATVLAHPEAGVLLGQERPLFTLLPRAAKVELLKAAGPRIAATAAALQALTAALPSGGAASPLPQAVASCTPIVPEEQEAALSAAERAQGRNTLACAAQGAAVDAVAGGFDTLVTALQVRLGGRGAAVQ